MNYFSIHTIRAALENLQPIDSKWLIIPLVLAANGVTATNKVDMQKSKGTGKFVKKFFDGNLMGLGTLVHGKQCNIRPGNSDRRTTNAKLIHVDHSDLWGKTYSQSGYGAMQDGLILKRPEDKGHFQLGPAFSDEFRNRIETSFKFESLLAWLYAFTGMPDTVSSWAELEADFTLQHTEGSAGIPLEYKTVFKLTPGEYWPADISKTRPTDAELQEEFLPELVSFKLDPASLEKLRNELKELVSADFIGLTEPQAKDQADAVIAALQSCRRLFLYGEPGIGKTELAQLIGTAFETVYQNRVHVVVAPVSDATSADKLIGFSTLDGSWVPGVLTQASGKSKKKLLYSEDIVAEAESGKRQINILILDEANRRDIEELLVKFQNALDSDSSEPGHDDFRIALDNAGELRISPNTFVVMTGNSPREDRGRIVQSRPFKRRHNFLPLDNLFRSELQKSTVDFNATIKILWEKVSPGLQLEITSIKSLDAELAEPENLLNLSALKEILVVLDSYAVGVSFGLAKKMLKTMAYRYALGSDFKESLDKGLVESVFSLLSGEEPIDGKSLKVGLTSLPTSVREAFPTFFGQVNSILRSADMLGRVRPFL
jgi:hypothetical protein